MKNKDNIVRQIYLSMFRDKKTASEIINYKNINEDKFEIGKLRHYDPSNAAGKSTLYQKLINDIQEKNVAIPNPIIVPMNYNTHPIDMGRVRMFMFRYYTGKVEWGKVFFGNDL
jgi:hypothetical protein